MYKVFSLLQIKTIVTRIFIVLGKRERARVGFVVHCLAMTARETDDSKIFFHSGSYKGD